MPLEYSHSPCRGVPSLPAAPAPVDLQNAESTSMYILPSLAREHISGREV